MLPNVVSVLVVVALAALFFFLLARALRSRRAAVKYPGAFFAGLLGVLCAVIAIVAIIGVVKIYSPQPHAVQNVKVSASPEQIARGQVLASLCIACHSSTGHLPLDGSAANVLEQFGAPPAGAFWAPNLTPAGPLKTWSDGEIIRAIREGVHQNGRTLLVMPAQGFHGMSDADVQSLVAYLRAQPAVDHQVPGVQPNLLGALLVGSGLFQPSVQAPITGPRVAPARAITPEYGEYVVNMVGCKDCHGPDLAGRIQKSPVDAPSAPNLRATAGTWAPADFVKTIKTGITPTGHQLSSLMPWKDYSALNEDELQAVHAYIQSLAVKQ